MRVVAFDTETRGLDWWDPEQTAFLASWADDDGEYVADLGDPAQVATFIEALESADVLVCHNLSFDVHQVRATLGWDALTSGKELNDTDLMSRVLDPVGAGQSRFGAHKLKNLAEKFLAANAKEAEEHIDELATSMGIKLKSTGAYYDVWRAYPEAMEEYARLDARYTLQLYRMFADRLAQDPRAAKVYDLERRVAHVLIRAEATGVRLDGERVQQLTDEYVAKQELARALIVETLGEEVVAEKGSEQALLDALTDLGVPLYRKTPSGKISTDKFALQEFEDEYPIIETLMEYRQAGKFLSTYLGPMQGRDVVHTSFLQIGAWTGRMSSMRPNMQNIPKRAGKEVREVYIPREGMGFVVSDYDSIEVRLLAWYLGDPGFRQLIDDGHDPHAWMAAQIHGGDMEHFAKDGPQDDVRSAAKNTLFAITYGAGAPRVADMNQISRDEAKSLIARIKSSLPGYWNLNKRIRAKVEDVGHVNTLWGRTNPVNPEKAYVGLNALIQGSAADIMKQGLVNVAEAVAPYGGTPLLVVHDEVVTECPIENMEQVRDAQEAALIGAYPLSPRLAVTSSMVTTSYAHA